MELLNFLNNSYKASTSFSVTENKFKAFQNHFKMSDQPRLYQTTENGKLEQH